MIVKITKTEFSYLLEGNILPNDLLNLLINSKRSSKTSFILELTADQADSFRDCLGEKLQECGFDKNYELTRDGELLEPLIDRFLVNSAQGSDP